MLGDIRFFSIEANRTTALMGSALVRNTLTFGSIIGLFLNKKAGAYLLVLAALLGLVRRAQFLAPVFTLSPDEAFLLVHSGADAVFRLLILVAGVGWLVSSSRREES